MDAASYQMKELRSERVSDKMLRRILTAENFQITYVEAKEDAEVPNHSHDNAEQITVMLEGSFMMVVEGKVHTLTKDSVLVIPRKVSHSGKVLKDCRYVDFHTAPVQLFKIPSSKV